MSKTMNRIFITGGGGFIGSSLALRLCEDNEIVIFDNYHRGRLHPLLKDHKNVTYFQGDILDPAALEEATQGCTHIFHMASIAGIDTVVRMPVKVMQVGIIGQFNVLEAAKKVEGLQRYISFSTSEIFGEFCYKPEEGETAKLGAAGEARWTYAVSKLAGEHIAYNYWKEFGVPSTSIRPFNIYGPGQIGEGAVHHFIVRAIKGEPLIVRNDGSQIRSWCFIDDIIDAMVLCIENQSSVSEIFNIGNPRSTLTIFDLAQKIIRLSNSESEIIFEKWDGADVDLRIPNIKKATDILGFEPKVELEEGLLRTIEWYREQIG